jgi:prolyl oligopeptidase
VYEGQPEDMYIAAARDLTPRFPARFVQRTIAFYNDELYLRGSDGTLAKVDAPNSAIKSVHNEWLLLELRDPYEAGGKTYPAGALIATKFDDFMAGKRDFTGCSRRPTTPRSPAILDEGPPGPQRAWRTSRTAERADAGAGAWARSRSRRADHRHVSVGAVDADESDAVWVTATDYLTPTTLRWPTSATRARSAQDESAFFDATRTSSNSTSPRRRTARASRTSWCAEGPEARRQHADAALRLRRLSKCR